MKIFKKYICMLLVLLLTAALLPNAALPVSALDAAESGAWGSNISWTLSGEGVLTVSGEGAMEDGLGGFSALDVKKVVISSGVTSIAAEAFAECAALTSVEIPEGVTTIGDYAFYGCTALHTAQLPESVTQIGESAFSACTALKAITIPGSVTSVGAYAFSECTALRSLTISEGVQEIAAGAFENCVGLTSVTLPNSALSVSADAFSGCTSLTGLLVNENNTAYASFDGMLFDKEMKTLLRCPAGKTGAVSVPNGVTYINDSAFQGCAGVTSVKLPKSAVKIGAHAFESCSGLSSVSLPEGITEMGKGAFAGCSALKSVELPKTVNAVAPQTFSGCYALRGVSVPEGVTSIGTEAFAYCAALTSIEIPCSVTQIGDEAFLSAGLEAIIFSGDAPQDAEDAFSSVDAIAYYPKENKTWTKTARAALGKNASLTWKAYALDEKPVITPLEITKQPKSVYARLDEKAKVTVKAVGDGLSYQWYYKNAGDSKYKKSTIQSPTYALKMTAVRHNKKLYCVVTDAYGNSVKSETVTMRMETTITAQPQTPCTPLGERAKFKVEAAGEGLKYQWYYLPAGAVTFKKASSSKAAYYPFMTEPRRDRAIYCIVTDKYGNAVQTDTVYMRAAASITAEPKSVKAAIGEKAKTTVKAVGDGLTYQWYYKDVGGKKYKKSSNIKATYTAEMKPERDGRKIYCVITDKYGNSVQSKTVTIKMK